MAAGAEAGQGVDPGCERNRRKAEEMGKEETGAGRSGQKKTKGRKVQGGGRELAGKKKLRSENERIRIGGERVLYKKAGLLCGIRLEEAATYSPTR